MMRYARGLVTTLAPHIECLVVVLLHSFARILSYTSLGVTYLLDLLQYKILLSPLPYR